MPENYGNRFLAKGSFLGSETQQKAFIWGGAKFVKITKVRGQRLGDGAIIDLSKGSSSYISKSSYSPSIRDNHCLINDGKDKFIVWGGENELTHLSDGAIYSLLSGTWTAIDKSEDAGGPEGREDAACFYDSLNKRMLMYGGLSSKILSDLWSLDLETLTWRLIHLSGPSLPKLYRPTIAFSPTQVLILGRTDNASYASLIDLEAESSINLAMEEASPGQSVLEDLKAVWSPTGFMVVAKGSGADSANYLWRLEAHPTNPSSYIWEQLSPAIDSSFIGTSINITDSYIITWGGREENGALNSKGTFRAIPKAP